MLLSQGVPMLLGGDEIGRTQGGNNNAYCQDNEISWFDWNNADLELRDFTAALIRLRRTHPTFHRRQFFQGHSLHGEGTIDLAWFNTDSAEMDDDAWNAGDLKTVTMYLGGDSIERGARGEQITDADFLWLTNAGTENTPFTIPSGIAEGVWRVLLDSATGLVDDPDAAILKPGDTVDLLDHSTVLLELIDEPQ